MGGSLFFLFFCHWRQLRWCALPPPKPPPNLARGACAFVSVSLFLCRVFWGAGQVGWIMLCCHSCLCSALFLEFWSGPLTPFGGKKGFPPNVSYRRSLPSFPLVSVNYILRKYQPIPYQNTNSGCNSTKLRPVLLQDYFEVLF